MIVQADGHLGHTVRAPYDAIHVGAAAGQVPQALLDQLAPGGRLVIPVGPAAEYQKLLVLDKAPDGEIDDSSEGMQVRYVPLIQRYDLVPSGK